MDVTMQTSPSRLIKGSGSPLVGQYVQISLSFKLIGSARGKCILFCCTSRAGGARRSALPAWPGQPLKFCLITVIFDPCLLFVWEVSRFPSDSENADSLPTKITSWSLGAADCCHHDVLVVFYLYSVCATNVCVSGSV